MKRSASGFVAILLFLSMSGAARAEEGAKYSAGLKTWINSWKSEKPGSEGMKSNSIALVGWEVEVEFSNRVYGEVSYLVSASDYKFNQAVVATQLERNDLDVAIGYPFNNTVGFFAGYRSSQFREKTTKDKETVSGPLAGFRGTARLNEALLLIGKLTYLPMNNKQTFSVTEEKETAPGWIAEAGVKYNFTSRTTGALGYKYETTKGKNTKVKDAFAGPTLEVMYSF